MKLKFLLCIGITAFFMSSCATTSHNKLTLEEKNAGWQLLFDGKTLNGWRDYNGEKLTVPWFAANGTIQAKGGGGDAHGYIVAKKNYENFDLVWDWKIAEGGNSGMLYHVVENPAFKVPYVTGPEYQLIDDIGFPEKLEDWQKTAADYAMHLADTKKSLKPAGEWNSSRILFDNGRVEHWLNGEKVVEFEA